MKEDIEALTQELVYQGPLEVLCVVRALLKKLQRRVFVGDFVVVSAMDWVARRGLVHSVGCFAPPLVFPSISYKVPGAPGAHESHYIVVAGAGSAK